MLNTGLNSERLPRGVGRARNRTGTGPIPTTLTITKGRSMEHTMTPMGKVTLVNLTAVLAGRTGAPHPPPQRYGEQGRYSVRDQVDTPGFGQGGSSTRQEVRRLSPLRGGLLPGVGCTGSPSSEGFSSQGH